MVKCPRCKGIGAPWNNSASVPCDLCNGSGKIEDDGMYSVGGLVLDMEALAAKSGVHGESKAPALKVTDWRDEWEGQPEL